MKCRSNARVPLWCNISGPGPDHVKHEDGGASPKMAKRLEGMLA
jgi:hypothetical protein